MNCLLNKPKVKHAHNIANNTYTNGFNCWGATLFVLDIIHELKWINCFTMKKFINTKTYLLDSQSKLKHGDILTLYGTINDQEFDLLHTATYIGGGKYWHKRGNMTSKYSTKKEVINEYNMICNIEKIEIRRLKTSI